VGDQNICLLLSIFAVFPWPQLLGCSRIRCANYPATQDELEVLQRSHANGRHNSSGFGGFGRALFLREFNTRNGWPRTYVVCAARGRRLPLGRVIFKLAALVMDFCFTKHYALGPILISHDNVIYNVSYSYLSTATRPDCVDTHCPDDALSCLPLA